ncbi:MAG: ATP-binding protein [Gemmatimonadetes bacterium]|nr:ATP-binding protein [Gemmatimonadota bacterium]MYA11679.1 ATP-binding protein [Gemmatimonadota bacterium]MYD13463.1 ATP-binding protein [Gemmatimonadota bacterium]MYE70171.1 ATP-binding protein [Gemmatimonadota bacterium]MYI66074.1 ATP-binding protein [Gemmatimonadota bacterium]
MIDTTIYPRLIEPHLVEALADSPAVLIHGPRQCGKTTLARIVGSSRGYRYVTFDDDVVRSAAQDDPLGFAAGLPERVILDEVQKAPALFPALKIEIDRRRTPGRFLLTGSTHVLLVPRLSESLAGRLQTLRLHPLAQCELEQRDPDFLDTLFAGEFTIARTERLGEDLTRRITGGGYPAALTRPPGRRRANWYHDHVDALVQHDVRDLARIRQLETLPRLLAAAAGQTARMFNVSDLAAPFELSRPTIRDYVTLLERVFLLERLPAWHSNRLTRLVKRPKLHLADTGVASALLGLDAPALAYDRVLLGQLLETFVLQELRRQASWHDARMSFHHFRDKDGVEVDIVIERGATAVAGVEVKASGTVRSGDFRGLRKLRGVLADRFASGVVLYDGEATVPFGDRLYGVPVRRLFGR